MMRFAIQRLRDLWCAVGIASVLLLVATSACGADDAPGLHLHVSVDSRDGALLESLVMEIDEVSAQESQSEIHDPWVPVTVTQRSVNLLSLDDGRSIEVAHATLPAGSYERVFLEPASITATTLAGDTLSVHNIVEPIAISFEIRERDSVSIELELILLEDIGGASGGYSLYCKDVRVVD